MEKTDEKLQRVDTQHQSPINETLACQLIEENHSENNTVMSIEERFSFERIEETAEKVQDFQTQIKTVSQSLQLQYQNTQKSVIKQGAQIECILQQQLPEQIENVEQSVLNLQHVQSISQKQQQLHESQIQELKDVIHEMQKAIRELQIKQQAVEDPNKENE
ncbi:hypothetical protein FGO68_gene12380 [Halteria grandinella]|uniref:Uncharacterized protein n=1 Tax=Halteria grandinella TaxID=5974 RepID=A0A8J8NSX9_HALGN|nr:hypothetical protein FGO68_gene12380 [Halteria grandinella]